MSQSLGNVVIAIKAVDEASTVMDKIQTNVGLLGGALQQLGGPLAGVGSVMEGFAAGGPGGAGMAALGQIGSYLQGAVKDAAESERVFTALGKAIENQGGNWDTMKSGIEGALTSMQSTSKFSDEELAASLRTLVSAGEPVNEALKTLSTAMDTAVGSGQPLDTVSTAIAKAFGGQDSALTRLVPNMSDLVKQLGPGATDGEKFSAAMDGLNQKFGGQAASDAATYAGTQERLKNAMGDLGEKIGNILTPALSSMSEALIPAVDAFGKGVDAVSSWITEVGKMPQIQGALDGVNTALSGFQKYIGDTWDSVKDDFGPALDELNKAFGDMGEALKPLWEAFGEIIKAMGGSGDDVNPLKILLEGVVLVIKGLAEVIKLAVPIVKGFAEGFKAAADAIAPPLKTISDAVGGFIKFLTDAFQGFYDWLVGHSLWQDLWDGLLSAAQSFAGMIGTFLGGMFDAWQTIFQGGMDLLQTVLVTGFDLAFTTIKTLVSGAVDVLTLLVGGVQSIIQGTLKDWTGLVSAVGTNITSMKGKISDFWGWATPFWKDQVNLVVTDFITKMDQIVAKLTENTGTMKTIWNDTLGTMLSKTQTILQQIYDEMNRQVNAIIQRLEDAKHKIASGSIWPDMLDEMLSQTKSGMAAIAGEFATSLQGPTGIVPVFAAASGQAAAAAPTAPTQSSPAQEITVPVNVYLDGQLIQSSLEKRLVETILQNASRSKRG